MKNQRSYNIDRCSITFLALLCALVWVQTSQLHVSWKSRISKMHMSIEWELRKWSLKFSYVQKMQGKSHIYIYKNTENHIGHYSGREWERSKNFKCNPEKKRQCKLSKSSISWDEKESANVYVLFFSIQTKTEHNGNRNQKILKKNGYIQQ